MARPASYPLALYRGDSYAWTFRVWQDAAMTIPEDLTGFTAAAQVRDKPGGTSVMDLACAITTAAGETVPNVVNVTLDASDWPAGALQVGAAAWDLQLTGATGEPVITIVAGAVTITQDVTVP